MRKDISQFTLILTAMTIVLSFTLSACGGGGGTVAGTTNTVETPGPTVPDSNQNPTPTAGNRPTSPVTQTESPALRDASLIKVETAYARNRTGVGITIGHYEQLIDQNHPELAGKFVGNIYDEIERGVYDNALATIEESRKHATQLATIAVGNRDNKGVHGIAYNARLNFVALKNTEFNRLVAAQYEQAGRGEIALSDIVGNTARAINYLNSRTPIAFSAHGPNTDFSSYTPEQTETVADVTGALTALRQTSSTAASRTMWVFAAGNESKTHPTGAAYYPVHFPELGNHVIAAVAVDQNGDIASYSNRCGNHMQPALLLPAPTAVRLLTVVPRSSILSAVLHTLHPPSLVLWRF